MIGLNLVLLIALIFFIAGLIYLFIYLFSSNFRNWLSNVNRTGTEKLLGKTISNIIYYQPKRYRLFSIISISVVLLFTTYLSIQLYLGFNLREARYCFNTRQYEDALIYYHMALIVKEKNVKKYPFLNYFYKIIVFYDDKVYTELGHTYWVEGFLHEAIAQYKRALSINPGKAKKAEYCYYIARTYAEMGGKKEALYYLVRAGWIDSKYLKKARVDNKFDLIRDSREFQELIGIY